MTVGGVESETRAVRAIVENTASILENPTVSLCDSVMLESNTSFTSDELVDATYQWQKYVVRESGEGYYVNLSDDESKVGLDYTVYEPGFFRIIITTQEGCKAVSENVEVTLENIIDPTISHFDLVICFDEYDNNGVTLSPSYGREITTYEWEESLDGIVFNPAGTDDELEVDNPTPVGADSSVRYYRLTLFEENCSKTSDVMKVKWARRPEATISHLGSTDDFFYCPTDAADQRVLNGSGAGNLEFSWYRLQFSEGLDLNFIRNELEEMQDLYDSTGQGIDFLPRFSFRGVGDNITLGEASWGLWFAYVRDEVTDCISRTNMIFVDSAIPDAELDDSIVCTNLTSVRFTPYDDQADVYEWMFSEEESGPYRLVGSDSEFVSSPSFTVGGGWYYLHVEKNGCEARTENVYLAEDSIETVRVWPTGTFDTFVDKCPGEYVELSIDKPELGYTVVWTEFGTNLVDFPELGYGPTFRVQEPGIYFAIYGNSNCFSASNSIFIDNYPTPSDSIKGLTSDSILCEPRLLELDSVGAGNPIQWYHLDGSEFVAIDGEIDSSFYASEIGEYFAEITSENCVIYTDTITVSGLLSPQISYAKDTLNICGPTLKYELSVASAPGVTMRWLYRDNESDAFSTLKSGENLNRLIVQTKGTYRIELQEGECTATDQIEVTIDETPEEPFQIEVFGDTALCQNDILTISSSISSDEVSFTWEYSLDTTDYFEVGGDSSFLVLDSVFIAKVLTADSVSVFIRLFVDDGVCAGLSEDHQIFIYRNISPRLVDGFNQPIDTIYYCTGEPLDLQVQLSTDWTTSPLNYQWQVKNELGDFIDIADASHSTYSITDAGVYRAYAFSNTLGGCPDTSQVITVMPEYIAELYSDTEILLCGEAVYHIISNHVEGANFQWYKSSLSEISYQLIQEGQNLTAIDVSDSGYYKVQINLNNCSVFSDSVKVELLSDQLLPEVAIDGENQFCFGDEMLFRSSYSDSETNYRWLVSINEGASFSELGTLDSLILPQPDFSELNGADYVDYQLQLIVEKEGCQVTSELLNARYYGQMAVSIFGPDETSTSDLFYCDNSDLGFQLVTRTNLTDPIYQWYSVDQESNLAPISLAILPSYQPSGPGTYLCEVYTSDGGCFVRSNSITIGTTPKSIFSADEDLAMCYGEPVELLVNSDFQEMNVLKLFDIQWYRNEGEGFMPLDGASSDVLIVEQNDEGYGSALYFYTASNSNCTTTSDTAAVYIEEIPEYTLNIQLASCFGINNGSITVNPKEDQFPLDVPLNVWELNGEESSSLVFDSLSVGVYELKVTTALGCSDVETVAVAAEKEIELVVDVVAPQRAGVPFKMAVTGATQYEWSPESYFFTPTSNEPTVLIPASVDADTLYVTVEGFDESGCSALRTIAIALESGESFVFSKLITPNGDGFNDYFEVLANEELGPGYLKVFDNWGREIYTVSEYENNSQEAHKLSDLLNEGTYFYTYSVGGQMFKGSFYCKP